MPSSLRHQESYFWQWWISSKGSFGENPERVKWERPCFFGDQTYLGSHVCYWLGVAFHGCCNGSALTTRKIVLSPLGALSCPSTVELAQGNWGESAQEMKKNHREKYGERKQFSHMCAREEQYLRKAIIGWISFETAWFWQLQLCYGLQSYLHSDCN